MTNDDSPRNQMTTMNDTQLRAVIGGLGGFGAMCHRGANVWRSLLQTLLVDALCGGMLGLLSGRVRFYPGSPRRGSADPGLYYATPLGLVWRGVEGRKNALPVQQQRNFVNSKVEAESVTVEKVIGRLLEMVKVETSRLK